MSGKYDKQMILDWLQQLLGELKSQQLELEGRSVPAGVRQGLAKFHSKWGAELVPSFDTFDFALAAFNGDEEVERKKLAEVRNQQFETAMDFWKVLVDVGIAQTKRQGQ